MASDESGDEKQKAKSIVDYIAQQSGVNLHATAVVDLEKFIRESVFGDKHKAARHWNALGEAWGKAMRQKK